MECLQIHSLRVNLTSQSRNLAAQATILSLPLRLSLLSPALLPSAIEITSIVIEPLPERTLLASTLPTELFRTLVRLSRILHFGVLTVFSLSMIFSFMLRDPFSEWKAGFAAYRGCVRSWCSRSNASPLQVSLGVWCLRWLHATHVVTVINVVGGIRIEEVERGVNRLWSRLRRI